MKALAIFWVLSMALFCVIAGKSDPVPDRILAAMDAGRARPVLSDSGEEMTVMASHEPLVLFRRPFDGLLSKILFITNFPATICTLAAVFSLREGSTSSRAISDIAGVLFLALSTGQWFVIAMIARVRNRRAA